MASMGTLRQHNYDDAGPGSSEGRTTRAAMPSRRLVRRLTVSLAFAVVVFAAAQLASYGPKTTPTPAFVNLALGAPQPHAQLTRRPAPDLSGTQAIAINKPKGEVETFAIATQSRDGVTRGA